MRLLLTAVLHKPIYIIPRRFQKSRYMMPIIFFIKLIFQNIMFVLNINWFMVYAFNTWQRFNDFIGVTYAISYENIFTKIIRYELIANAVNVTGNVSVPIIAENLFGPVTGLTVTIQGRGTLAMSNANVALLRIGARQTVIARNVTLQGRSGNGSALVVIEGGGTFREKSV